MNRIVWCKSDMKKRDYYDILGVARDADADTIKKAYRKLARKWHPDINKDDKASERFAEIQEAYDILSDEEKRKQYDRFGHVGVGAGPFGGGGGQSWGWDTSGGVGGGVGPNGVRGAGGTGGAGPDLGSIFEELFGVGGRGGRRRGGGGSPFGGATRRAARKGEDIHHAIHITFQTAAHGGKEQLRVSAGDHGELIDVSIPAGIEDGTKLRLRGKGQPGSDGGAGGDLILTVRVGAHPYYRREGLHILLDVPITMAEAVTGTTVTVPTLKGRVELKVPVGAQSGQKLRVPGHGIVKKGGQAGDFFAVLKVVTPSREELSVEDFEYFEGLRQRLPSVRKGGAWG